MTWLHFKDHLNSQYNFFVRIFLTVFFVKIFNLIRYVNNTYDIHFINLFKSSQTRRPSD